MQHKADQADPVPAIAADAAQAVDPWLLIQELQAQLANETAMRRLRDCAMNAAETHFMISDRSGRIVFVNRALANSHGYEPEELLGRAANLLVPADLNPQEVERIAAALREWRSTRVEVRSRRRDGTLFWAGISIAPIRNDDGQVTHFVSLGSDITRRLEDELLRNELQERLVDEMRQREEIAIELRMAQKLESVGRLAAGVAHEINTPIQYVGDNIVFLQTAITDVLRVVDAHHDDPAGAAEMEAEVDLDFLRQEAPKAIERAHDGVERVASIVRAMKEFAHPGTARSSADLNRALETTVTVARGEYKFVATVECQLGDIPPVVCNLGELNQVFLNLLVNAAHAIEQSGKDSATGRIVITTACHGEEVEISMADNGCGIADEHLDKIFDPFFTTKEVGKGTGQGLAIARSIIVEKHGGSIDVRSTVGEGTTIVIRLPLQSVEAT
jgi:two-component system, NtrC family, sensor kinase